MAHRLVLHFDGGSRGNPGPGYGSYVLVDGDRELARRRLDLGLRMTNNEAEYETLIAGLADTLHWLEGRCIEPSQVRLQVRGDSQLVLRQLAGTWKSREPRMAALRDRALALLRRFGCYDLRHVPRQESVELLGH